MRVLKDMGAYNDWSLAVLIDGVEIELLHPQLVPDTDTTPVGIVHRIAGRLRAWLLGTDGAEIAWQRRVAKAITPGRYHGLIDEMSGAKLALLTGSYIGAQAAWMDGVQRAARREAEAMGLGGGAGRGTGNGQSAIGNGQGTGSRAGHGNGQGTGSRAPGTGKAGEWPRVIRPGDVVPGAKVGAGAGTGSRAPGTGEGSGAGGNRQSAIGNGQGSGAEADAADAQQGGGA